MISFKLKENLEEICLENVDKRTWNCNKGIWRTISDKEFHLKKYYKRLNYSEVMSATMNTRAALLQLFPPLTIISVYTMFTSKSSPFIFARNNQLPQWLSWTDKAAIAMELEKKTLTSKEIEKYKEANQAKKAEENEY
jgi:hypothetical protein